MRVLVCGGRHYRGRKRLFAELDRLHGARGIDCIIQGGATGADAIAKEWARLAAVPSQEFCADWDMYGRAAGPMRNRKMLEDGKPDVVIAAPGGAGTASMVRLSEAAGVNVHWLEA